MKQKMWQEWTYSLPSTKGRLFKWPSILLVEDGHSGHSGWMAFFRFSMTLRLFSVSPLLPCYEHNSQIRHGMLESQIWRGKHLDARDTEKRRQFAVWECLGKTSMFQNVPRG